MKGNIHLVLLLSGLMLLSAVLLSNAASTRASPAAPSSVDEGKQERRVIDEEQGVEGDDTYAGEGEDLAGEEEEGEEGKQEGLTEGEEEGEEGEEGGLSERESRARRTGNRGASNKRKNSNNKRGNSNKKGNNNKKATNNKKKQASNNKNKKGNNNKKGSNNKKKANNNKKGNNNNKKGNNKNKKGNNKKRGPPKRKGGNNKNAHHPSMSTDCECGQKLMGTRIVGGKPTTRDEYPWQAAILSAADESLICSGTLINDRYILTAAHCVADYANTDLIIRLRDYNLNKPDQAKEISMKVEKIKAHKKFNAPSIPFDIALLKMESNLTMAQMATVKPICLPSTNTELYERTKAIATGWGATSFSNYEESSNVLREVRLRVIPNRKCRKDNAYSDLRIKNNMLCAGREGRNICLRDEGGPLAYLNDDGRYEQIGITGFGFQCGDADEPSVFSRVNKYSRWIQRLTRDATYCSGFSFP